MLFFKATKTYLRKRINYLPVSKSNQVSVLSYCCRVPRVILDTSTLLCCLTQTDIGKKVLYASTRNRKMEYWTYVHNACVSGSAVFSVKSYLPTFRRRGRSLSYSFREKKYSSYCTLPRLVKNHIRSVDFVRKVYSLLAIWLIWRIVESLVIYDGILEASNPQHQLNFQAVPRSSRACSSSKCS